MPRTQGDKLQFQLEAFRFQQADRGLVCDGCATLCMICYLGVQTILSLQLYVTCFVKVAASSTPTSPEQKACSFSANGYVD